MALKEDQRERSIELLSRHFLETGLTKTSLRQLAAAARVSDRMLLYYFKDKAEVIERVMAVLSDGFVTELKRLIPDGQRLPPGQLVVIAAGLVQDETAKPHMRLWMETISAAARKEEPFVGIAARTATGLIAVIESRLAIDDPEKRRNVEAMLLAMVDGLAILDASTAEGTSAGAAKEFLLALGPD